jgi:Transposase
MGWVNTSQSQPGGAVTVTVKALNAHNHVVMNYTGPVHFSSNDPQARLPADSTLVNGQVLTLAEELAAMFRKQSATSLQQWLVKAEACASPDMKGFAQGIRQDEAAVAAAISQPWSNGPVEGQVNRLKMIKRQMYGRASFKLLRARVLYAG